jgi:hypothetical protein
MRKMATSFLAVGLLITAFASAAMAGSLLTDNFVYPDGNLSGNGAWTVFSGAPPTDIQVVSGRAVGSQANAPDDHNLFTAQSTNSKTYMCFDVIIPDPGGNPKLVYFAMLKDAGTALFVSRTYVAGLTSGGWTFAVSHSSTNATTAGITLWSLTSLNYGQQYRLVVNYDPVAQSSTLWVDPVNELSPSVTNTNTAIAPLAVQSVALRQSSTASTVPPSGDYTPAGVNWVYSLDNLGVGTSMADACDGITPADKSTWGRLKAIYRN